MKSLLEYVRDAQKHKRALGHFNISDSNQFNAVVAAAKEVGVPVIIGVSESERAWIGLRQAVALVASVRAEGYPVYLNADHTYSLAKAKEAIDLCFDSVIIDGAKLSHEENVKMTRECVAYAEKSGREVVVEGELGYIGQSSQMHDVLPEGVAVGEHMMTTSEELSRFVEETGVDLMAPAVGNIHGIIKGGDPRLSISRIEELSRAVSVPLVLHGASGNTQEDLRLAAGAGMALIHISTELRLAYRQGIEEGLRENEDELAPYRFFGKSHERMKQLVVGKLRIISGR